MKTFTSKFKLYIDPRYFGFKREGGYITVEYSAIVKGDTIKLVTIMELSSTPDVFGYIMLAGQWLELSREMHDAAKDHAVKELSGMDSNVHPTIMKAIAPHMAPINH